MFQPGTSLRHQPGRDDGRDAHARCWRRAGHSALGVGRARPELHRLDRRTSTRAIRRNTPRATGPSTTRSSVRRPGSAFASTSPSAGGSPLWADAGPIPASARTPLYAWKPRAAEYEAFVHAVGTRYSGHYLPPGQLTPLPRVDFWGIWNEPNFGKDLDPAGDLRLDRGDCRGDVPRARRRGLERVWATGHGHDTILIGSPRRPWHECGAHPEAPDGRPGNFGTTKPLRSSARCTASTRGTGRCAEAGASRIGCPQHRRFERFRAPTQPCSRRAASPIIRIRSTSPPNRATPTTRTTPSSASCRTSRACLTGCSALTARTSAFRSTSPSTGTSRTRRTTATISSRPATAAVVHQLGGVPVVAQPADRHDDAVPARGSESPRRRPGVRRLRRRARVLRRQAQAERTTPTACRCSCP